MLTEGKLRYRVEAGMYGGREYIWDTKLERIVTAKEVCGMLNTLDGVNRRLGLTDEVRDAPSTTRRPRGEPL